MTIERQQIRMARARLEIDQETLGFAIDMDKSVLSRIESGNSKPHQSTLDKIEAYFDSKGLIFSNTGGVDRILEETYKTFRGQTGFRSLMDNVHQAALDGYSIFRIQNAQPENWYTHLGVEWYAMHAKRMQDIYDARPNDNKINFKITTCEGDEYQIANKFAEYRWVKKQHFKDMSIYVYGDNVAYLNFQDEEVVIHNLALKDVALTMIDNFDSIWENYTTPPPAAGVQEHEK